MIQLGVRVIMDSLIQSEIFQGLVGLSFIVMAVFAVFILGLSIKVLSDLSQIINKIKKETDDLTNDLGVIKGEIKGLLRSVGTYFSVLLTADGLKQVLAMFMNRQKKKKAKRVKVSSNNS